MRCRFCGVIFLILVVLAALWLGSAKANDAKPAEPTVVGVLNDVSTGGHPFTMTLYDGPCVHPSMQFIWEGVREEVRKQWEPKIRAAKLKWQDKDYESCWVDLGEMILFVDSAQEWFNGRAGLPRNVFKPVGLKI